ncbi:MAG: hypothetical protein ACLP36_10500 [Acidimicrobiales bacterium]
MGLVLRTGTGFAAGTFRQHADRVFWYAHHGANANANAIAIELEHEQCRRLIVEVPDPKATAQLIEDHLRHEKDLRSWPKQVQTRPSVAGSAWPAK